MYERVKWWVLVQKRDDMFQVFGDYCEYRHKNEEKKSWSRGRKKKKKCEDLSNLQRNVKEGILKWILSPKIIYGLDRDLCPERSEREIL